MHRNGLEEENLKEGLRRLRELGYLSSPAEEFVARRVPYQSGSWKVALVSGAWLGGGGGILVGLLLAVSVVVAQPALLDHPADLAWLTLDLLVAGTLLGAVAVTLITWPLVTLHRSGRRSLGPAARIAELAVPLVPALYLCDVFGRFLLPRLAGGLWLAGGAVAAGIATILGEAWARPLRVLVAVAGLPRGAPLPKGRTGTPTRLAVLAASLLLLLLGPYRGLRPLPRLDQVGISSTPDAVGSGVDVILLDGTGPKDAPRTMARLAGPAVEVEDDSLAIHPESFWSTVATGFPPRIHGLVSPAAPAPAGVSAGLGKATHQPLLQLVVHGLLPGMGLGAERAHDQRELLRPPFWEIAVHCGRPAAVFDAWATYPAARHPGLAIVSDRCFLRMWDGDDAGSDPLAVQPARTSLVQEAREILARRVQYPELVEGDSLLANLPFRQLERFREVWDYAAASDLFHVALAREARADSTLLIVLQLNGADLVRRAVERAKASSPIAGREAERLSALYLRFTDHLLEELLADSGKRGSVVVFSRVEESAESVRRRAWVWPGRFAGRPPSVLSLAPRILEELQIPPARDMPRAGSSGPPTWGLRPDWTPPAGRSRQDLERLKSLGYIGGHAGKR